MKRAGQSLKRAAPGASPASSKPPANPPQPPQIQTQQDVQYLWNHLPDVSMNPSLYGAGNGESPEYNGATYIGDPAMNDPTATLKNTGELVRRNANTQLSIQGLNQWDDAQVAAWEDYDDDDQLDQRALEAMRDATAKKRQIPPFVQKLSSFLDDPQNADFIRWTDDGLSFVVLDEDEFAKKLIPHLFKHNNYASFVRQLNMYGFHKQVGLSDNSMRSSESKKKAPSRYSNPYFRRGRPNLLWLIIKPKNPPSHKKSLDGKVDVDVEAADDSWQQPKPAEKRTDPSKETVSMTRSELDKLRQEIVGLKKQNQLIMSYIGTMRKRSQDSEEQVQQMRRHESSINAIMTFLATFYSRSVDGQTGANLANMFSGSIPGGNQSANIINMTDMHDNLNMNLGPNTPFSRARRRLLLPAPDTAAQIFAPPVVEAPSSRPLAYQPAQVVNIESPSPKVDMETPKSVQDDFLSMLTAANTASPATPAGNNFDFDSALQHIQTADGNTPLTDQQKNDMIQRMSQEVYSSAATSAAPIASTSDPLTLNPLTPFSLDDLAVPPPSAIPNSLDYVQKLQEEQDKKVQSLADKLGPLSPNGFVPGLYDTNVPPPADWDLEDLLNDSYFPEDAAEMYNQGSPSNINVANPSSLVVPNVVSAQDPIFADQNTAEVDGGLQNLGSTGTSPATIASVDDGDVNGSSTQTPSRKRQRRD